MIHNQYSLILIRHVIVGYPKLRVTIWKKVDLNIDGSGTQWRPYIGHAVFGNFDQIIGLGILDLPLLNVVAMSVNWIFQVFSVFS